MPELLTRSHTGCNTELALRFDLSTKWLDVGTVSFSFQDSNMYFDACVFLGNDV